MRILANSLLNIMFTILKVSVVTYALSILIQLFTDYNWLDVYNHYLIQFAHYYLSWTAISLYFLIVLSSTNYTEQLSAIRYTHYLNEIKRWQASAYIAPTHLHYLLSPPQAFSKKVIDQLEDPLYVQTIHDFRDHVYSNDEGHYHTPKQASRFSLFSSEQKSQLCFHSLIIILCCMVPYLFGYSLLQQPANLAILILIYSSNKLFVILFSYKQFNLSRFNSFLSSTYPNPIQWEHCYQSTSIGQNIILSWENESDRRVRLYKQLYRNDANYKDYPSIPPAPFPDLRVLSEPPSMDAPVLLTITNDPISNSNIISLKEFRKQKIRRTL